MSIHICLLIIGILGLCIGTLPDLFPNQIDSFLIGKYKKMNIAYKRLVDYAKIPRGIRDNEIALNKNDLGYEVIYNHLRSLDPSLPPFNKSGNSFADITIDTGGFMNTNMELLMNQVVQVKDSKNNWLPVCEMRELYFIIRDSYIRFFTRLGLSFAFIALFVGFVMNVKQVK